MKSVATAAALAALLGPSAAHAAKAKVDQPAPDFRITTLTKDKIDLASLRGKVVVVNRWATWCVPCREEFLLFEKYMPFRAKYGFTVVAIETGGAGSSSKMRELAKIVHFPVALDDNAHANAYPIIDNGVPTNYVIDRAGVVRYAKAGAFQLDELEKLVVPLLNEPAPADPPPAATAPNK
jgi:peroxiredoxin